MRCASCDEPIEGGECFVQVIGWVRRTRAGGLQGSPLARQGTGLVACTSCVQRAAALHNPVQVTIPGLELPRAADRAELPGNLL